MTSAKIKSLIPYVVAGVVLVIVIYILKSSETSHKQELADAIAANRDTAAYYKGIAAAKDSLNKDLLKQDSAHKLYIAELEGNVATTIKTVYIPVYTEVKSGGPADQILRAAVAEYRGRKSR